MSLELIGKLAEKMPLESGTSQKTGKQWQKLGFVLQLEGKYPKQVHIESFNAEVIAMIQDTSLDTELKCEIDVSSRSWTSPQNVTKWFTSVSAWKVEVHRSEEYAAPKQADNIYQPTPPDDASDLPF